MSEAPLKKKKPKGKKAVGPSKMTRYRWLLLGSLLLPVILPFTPFGGPWRDFCVSMIRAIRGESDDSETQRIFVERPVEVVREVVKEVPAAPEPLPTGFVARKETDVATLFNGINIQTELQTKEGGSASEERGKPESFQVDFAVKLTVPKASSTLVDLEKINPNLGKILPSLEGMVKEARVSGFYHKMYASKSKRVASALTRLDKALDRHNFFDTETILELVKNDRKTLLIQSDMDVVSDGSDGDRLPELTDYITMSDHYQPFTSYGWTKQTDKPNPLLMRWKEKLHACKREYAIAGLSAARNTYLRDSIAELKRGIDVMKTTSWLIAEKDPFIVMSLAMVNQVSQSGFAPMIGDYAVVIHGDKLYPCIVGDAGPSFKNGEASLFLAKLVNEKATPFRRPESDLKVTYIVFPNSRDKPFRPPNLATWKERCAALLQEIGGIGPGYELFEYLNPFPNGVEPTTEKASSPNPASPTPTPLPPPGVS